MEVDHVAESGAVKAGVDDRVYRLILRQLVDDGLLDAVAAIQAATNVSLDDTTAPGQLSGIINSAAQPTQTSSAPPNIELDDSGQRSRCDYVAGSRVSHKQPLRCVAVRSRSIDDGAAALFASGDDDGTVRIFDGSNTADVRTYYDANGAVSDVTFHPFEPFLAAAALDGAVRFYDHSHIKRVAAVIHESAPVRSAHFHPAGDFIAVATDSAILRLYDTVTTQPYVTVHADTQSHTAPPRCVRWSRRGGLFASSSADGVVKVWDTISGELVTTIAAAHGGSEVTSLCFNRDDTALLTCGRDHTTRLIDVSSHKVIATFVGATHSSGRPMSAIFDHSDEFVLSGDELSNDIFVWSVNDGALTHKLSGHSGSPRVFASASNQSVFISGADDKTTTIWNSKEQSAEHDD